ncbi:hypothetical protein [Lentisphaera araneosa]|uniref:hypothetical protein n=1 Tax=Lentisphaera araneosa TaxID=256847 RepID=UPI00138A3092|nr:hypothetical protein [Lentisphaera araneosa]
MIRALHLGSPSSSLAIANKKPLRCTWDRQAPAWQLRIKNHYAQRSLRCKIVRVAHCRSLISFTADRTSPFSHQLKTCHLSRRRHQEALLRYLSSERAVKS